MKIKYLASTAMLSALAATTFPIAAAEKLESVPYSPTVQSLLTPASPIPVIHGPAVTGVSPKRPFLYLIPSTGKAPLTYAAANLPAGLRLDTKTGIINGSIEKAGNYEVRFTVSGPAGKTSRAFTIICGPGKIALTPPMGWNSWGVFGEDVTALKVREQADWMIRSGLAARGFQYIIVDDTWQARRAKDGTISPNRRFGSMRALANYVHQRGLKIGLVSSPNIHTPTGHAGSAGYEEQDAARYADWGIDYLKYDWSPEDSDRNKITREQMQTAYNRMRTALAKVNRDIVFSAVTYGFGGSAEEWAASVGANSWTLNPGMVDKWDNLVRNGFSLSSLSAHAGPGHWNDPGTLMLGRFIPRNPRFTRLNAEEQRSQVALWSLTAAPLMLSCNLSQLDPNNFHKITTALLINPEVLSINQDPLGQSASRMGDSEEIETWARPLADGTLAVGLFNTSARLRTGTLRWRDIGLQGAQPVRDVWLRKNLGSLDTAYTVTLPPHGSLLLKIGQSKPVKIDSRWYVGAGKRKSADTRDIVPLSFQETASWRYTFEKPEDNWMQREFSDRRWQTGLAGFGKASGKMLSRTDWTGEEIWMRKSLNLRTPVTGKLQLLVQHGGDTEIYLNGILAAKLTGVRTGYIVIPLSNEVHASLRDWNTVAAHSSQQDTRSGIDIGLRLQFSGSD